MKKFTLVLLFAFLGFIGHAQEEYDASFSIETTSLEITDQFSQVFRYDFQVILFKNEIAYHNVRNGLFLIPEETILDTSVLTEETILVLTDGDTVYGIFILEGDKYLMLDLDRTSNIVEILSTFRNYSVTILRS